MIHPIVEKAKETILKVELLGITYKTGHRKGLMRSLLPLLPPNITKGKITNGSSTVTRNLISVTITAASTNTLLESVAQRDPKSSLPLPLLALYGRSHFFLLFSSESVLLLCILLTRPGSHDCVLAAREARNFSSYCYIREIGHKVFLQIQKDDR